MSALLKLFKFKKIILAFFLISLSQGCSSEEKSLPPESLKIPEELKLFVKSGLSEENKRLAEYPYSGAIINKEQNDWAAAAKGFGEASLVYPTAKSLIGLSESKAKFYTHKRFGDKVAIAILGDIEKYLRGAIAVDSIQKKMTKSETKEVNNDIICINEFLRNRVNKDNCKYVNYVYLMPE